jgi:hypothetical protein
MWTARLCVLCLSLLLCMAFVGYGAAMSWIRRSPVRKIGLLITFVGITLGLVLGQLDVYTTMTGVTKPLDADSFVFVVLMLENVVGTAIIFFFVLRETGRIGKH